MAATQSIRGSGNSNVDGLLSGQRWAVSTLSFSSPSTGTSYGNNYGYGEATDNFATFSSDQMAAVRVAFGMFGDFLPLSFAEATGASRADATLRFAETGRTATAWGYGPAAAAIGGDVWFSRATVYDRPVIGSYAFDILLHEMGHALGLKHPHEVSGSFAAQSAARDTVEFSVMSYRSYQGASTARGLGDGGYGLPQTPMMDDIAALQYLYGADYKTRAGNTVYSWRPGSGTTFIDGKAAIVPGGQTIFLTVWDGGGSDTYDFTAFGTGVAVDLAPGGWSTASRGQLAHLGDGYYARGNVANALLYQGNAASLIENAFGGTGDDVIAGNQAGNDLRGNRGADTLSGGDGNDRLSGGDGNDTLNGGNGNDALSGDAGNDRIFGGEGADIADGGDGNDSLVLDGGNDTGRGGNGDDLLSGGAGNDALYGGAGLDRLEGGLGDDFLAGDDGDDSLFGNDGTDTLLGGAGRDTLTGLAGRDRLEGGAGNDLLYGGAAADTFAFTAPRWGADTLYDFEDGRGTEDVIVFSRSVFANYNAVAAAMHASGQNVLIYAGADQSLLVLNTTIKALGADDFQFV